MGGDPALASNIKYSCLFSAHD